MELNEKVIYSSEDVTKVFRDNPKGKVFGVERIFETDKYLFLEITRIMEFDILCIYNKTDKTSILCDGATVHQSFDEIFCQIRGVCGNKVITWDEANFFKLAYENNWSKNNSLCRTVQRQLKEVDKNLGDEDNFVVYICNLK
ncbi:MAG: hypothetical protein LBM08_05525 [Dysgonamonadaceae bacterium]|nr:hypothetical protein [Dysgonamonadaceae bacterium]